MVKSAFFLIVLSLFIVGCGASEESAAEEETTRMVLVNDTIPVTRISVNKNPVATYDEKIPDALNDWRFAVDIFETSATFEYQMKIRYKELLVTDTLKIPNFGIQPVVKLEKGKDDLSCIVGFEDKQGEVKPYKVVEVVNGQLKVRVLKHYRAGIFRKPN